MKRKVCKKCYYNYYNRLDWPCRTCKRNPELKDNFRSENDDKESQNN